MCRRVGAVSPACARFRGGQPPETGCLQHAQGEASLAGGITQTLPPCLLLAPHSTEGCLQQLCPLRQKLFSAWQFGIAFLPASLLIRTCSVGFLLPSLCAGSAGSSSSTYAAGSAL